MPGKINIKPNTYIYLVLLLFLVPLRWLLAWVFAAVIHEMCHYFAVRLCGGEIYRITIGLGGAEMQCSPMSRRKCFFAVLAGPLGGMIPVLFAQWMPYVALCCCALSAYNLLPLLHLDGGRAVEIIFGQRAVHIQRSFLILLTVCTVYSSFVMRLGLLPLVATVLLWLKNRNNPCKPGCCKVQ